MADREEYAPLSEFLDHDAQGRPLINGIGDLLTSELPGARELGLRAANLGVLSWGIWERGTGGSLSKLLADRQWRCLVVDLGSLNTTEEQGVVASCVLDTLWDNRRGRDPVLIVMDEAHTICPQQSDDRVVRLATRRAVQIAGEGRKFGLYLLVSTQRPQKVHENVLSQCDNLMLMRMNSAADLAHLEANFSFVPWGLLQQATYFGLGEARSSAMPSIGRLPGCRQPGAIDPLLQEWNATEANTLRILTVRLRSATLGSDSSDESRGVR